MPRPQFRPGFLHSDPRVGCALAHAEALRGITEPTLVLEDDAEWVADVELPPSWDLVWLGGSRDGGKGPNGTHAYLVKPHAAAFASKVFSGACTSPDFYWSVFECELEVYTMLAYKQDGSRSDIRK